MKSYFYCSALPDNVDALWSAWKSYFLETGIPNTIIIVKVTKKCPLEEESDFCGHQMEKIDNFFHIAKRSGMSSDHINMSL